MTTSQPRKPKAFPCKSLPKNNSKRWRNNEVWRFLPCRRPPLLPQAHTCGDTLLPSRPVRVHPSPSGLSDHPAQPHEMPPAPRPRGCPTEGGGPGAAPQGETHGAVSLSVSLGTCGAGGSQPSTSWDASHTRATVRPHGSSLGHGQPPRVSPRAQPVHG